MSPRKHCRGWSSSRTYTAWAGAKCRCRNPRHADYASYGGRGITFSPRWDKFAQFLIDLGPCPPGHELDRIDVNGNYEPGNVRWHPRGKGATRRSVKLTISIEGLEAVDITIPELAELLGIEQDRIRSRLLRGAGARALITPVIPRRRRGSSSGGSL